MNISIMIRSRQIKILAISCFLSICPRLSQFNALVSSLREYPLFDFLLMTNVTMSDRSELKHKYPSGASMRRMEKDATKNTAGISSYFAADWDTI